MEYFDNTAVVLPFIADGKTTISTTLSWDSEVVPTLRGSEGRGGYRSLPKPKLEFTAHVSTVSQTSMLRARLQAAFDRQAAGGGSGRVAVPWQARGCWLAAYAATGATSLTLEATPWPWRNGDGWIAFPDLQGAATSQGWQYGRVTGINGTFQLGLDAPLTDPLFIGAVVFPLFVGRLEVPERAGFITDARLRQSLTVNGDRQLIDINEPPGWPPGTGGTGGTGSDPSTITCEQLMAIWHALNPQPEAVATSFPVAAPAGYVHCRACLRFVRVSGGVVTHVYCGPVTQPAKDVTVSLALGATAFYAVEYWGYRGFQRDVPPHTPRPWISSSDNFRIYLVPMPP